MPDMSAPATVAFVPYTPAPTHLGAFIPPTPFFAGCIPLLNNAEVANSLLGATVTQGAGGNTGGSAGNFLDLVQIGANASLIFDNTFVAHGSYSYRVATGASAVQSNMSWSASIGTPVGKLFWRIYVQTPSSFAVAPSLTRMLAGGAQVSRIAWNTSGNLLIRDSGNALATGGTSATVFTTSTRYRVEGYTLVGTTGTSELKIFPSMDSSIPIETITVTGNFGTANIDQWSVGQIAALANVPAWWFDDIGVSPCDYLGPVGPDMAPARGRGTSWWRPAFLRRRTPVVSHAHLAPPVQGRPRRPAPKVARPRPTAFVPDQAAPPSQDSPHRPIPRLGRPRRQPPVPAQIAPPPAYPPQGDTPRPRGLRVPSRHATTVPPTQSSPPPGGRARIRAARVTPHRATQVPPAQIAPPPPYPPRSVHPKTLGAVVPRRRSTATPPRQDAAPLVGRRPSAPKVAPPRRHPAIPVPAQVPVPPPFAPRSWHPGLRAVVAARARRATAPLAQSTPPPRTHAVAQVRAPVRGRRLSAPAPTQDRAPLRGHSTLRVPAVNTRRRSAVVPVAQAAPVTNVRRIRVAAPRPRLVPRAPVPPQVTPPAPPFIPSTWRGRLRAVGLLRRHSTDIPPGSACKCCRFGYHVPPIPVVNTGTGGAVSTVDAGAQTSIPAANATSGAANIPVVR